MQAIGLSPFEAPDIFAGGETSSPYGKKVVTSTEVNEIFFKLAGNGNANLIGHQNENVLISQLGENGNIAYGLENAKFSVTAAGNFANDEKGRKNHIAVLYVDNEYKLHMGVRSASDSSGSKTDLSVGQLAKPDTPSQSNTKVNKATMIYQKTAIQLL